MNKKIYDPIHKYMEFEPILLKIIDTPEFQRLKNIKQLGVCYYVFSGASHNRFEHSLGVSHLANILMNNLKNKQPELKITDRQILLVKIAGLVHDLGHSCFSHFFDNYFIKDKFKNNPNTEHEQRSKLIFKKIISKYEIDLSEDEIKFICDLIEPNEKQQNYIYQIISNNKSSIDCDKFDYLLRDTYNIGLPYTFDYQRFLDNIKVIDNTICFSDKLVYDIYDLFNLRFRLHKQICNHHTVNQIEHMILDVFNLVDPYFNISNSILNMDKFICITDNILEEIYYCNIDNPEVKKAKEIINNIKLRKLYKLENEILLKSIEIPNEIKEKYNNFQDIFCKSINVINYTKGDNNPLEFIYLFNGNMKFLFDKNKIKVCPKEFQEIILRVIKKF